jgi:hypothetical protein
MGILDEDIVINPPSAADSVAQQLIFETKQTFARMARAFNNGTQAFWANPSATPAEIAASLGTNAVEMFTLHYQLSTLLNAIDPTSIAESLALIGTFTMNQDGSVTNVVPVETP